SIHSGHILHAASMADGGGPANHRCAGTGIDRRVNQAMYSKVYYETVYQQVRDSAREVVPLVVELMHPRRVIDVGCGTGTWLAAFALGGAPEILGLDGEYVAHTLLDIPPDCFMASDLGEPLPVTHRYDLAVCLEVAEHLPAGRAAGLVQELTHLAPVVL